MNNFDIKITDSDSLHSNKLWIIHELTNLDRQIISNYLAAWGIRKADWIKTSKWLYIILTYNQTDNQQIEKPDGWRIPKIEKIHRYDSMSDGLLYLCEVSIINNRWVKFINKNWWRYLYKKQFYIEIDWKTLGVFRSIKKARTIYDEILKWDFSNVLTTKIKWLVIKHDYKWEYTISIDWSELKHNNLEIIDIVKESSKWVILEWKNNWNIIEISLNNWKYFKVKSIEQYIIYNEIIIDSIEQEENKITVLTSHDDKKYIYRKNKVYLIESKIYNVETDIVEWIKIIKNIFIINDEITLWSQKILEEYNLDEED